MCAADNPFCSNLPISSTPAATTTECGTVPIDLRPAGVNVMIAVDGSSPMTPHWADVQTAIRSLRAANPFAAFGVHKFWSDRVDLSSGMDNTGGSNNACTTLHNDVLALGDHGADEMVGMLGSNPPVLGDEFYPVAPVIDAINEYAIRPTPLADPERTNYLVLFTRGNDTCFGNVFIPKSDKLLAYQKLGDELSKRNIRVIPVGVDPKAAGPVDPGFLGSGTTTDYEALGVLLKHGGSGLTEVPRIDTPMSMADLVSRVGKGLNNCRFDIPAALDASASVNPFELSFTINGVEVQRDRHLQNGWDFVNGGTNRVEFFGQGCQALQQGHTLQAKKSCQSNVCGTAAVSASTRPRAVLFLLDSSLPRNECSTDPGSCLLAGAPTFWTVTQRAVQTAMMAPVNDDVEFGLQFFPNKNAEAISCEVDKQPEHPPLPGTQIALMKAMLEKIPFGSKPLVSVMENVAAAPGRLSDPSAVGAVVLLSDGGDDCSGDPPQQIVTRLGAAAKKLFDAGVRTYAIRYGSAGTETQQQAAELTEVAMRGGTALFGARTAYLDAKSEDDLTRALASISDELATCSFTLGNLKPGVDKNRTSLYLNGEQVGFDVSAKKRDGWNWTDSSRTSVELYGNACSAFKSSRNTAVVVEFGCEPIVIAGPD